MPYAFTGVASGIHRRSNHADIYTKLTGRIRLFPFLHNPFSLEQTIARLAVPLCLFSFPLVTPTSKPHISVSRRERTRQFSPGVPLSARVIPLSVRFIPIDHHAGALICRCLVTVPAGPRPPCVRPSDTGPRHTTSPDSAAGRRLDAQSGPQPPGSKTVCHCQQKGALKRLAAHGKSQ